MVTTPPPDPAGDAPAQIHSFTDRENREWVLCITVADIKRVRDMLKLDLLSIEDGVLFDRLATDPMLLCDLLWVLVSPAAVARGVTDEQFGQGLAGESIDKATSALLGALVDFFPWRRRTLLKKQLEKLKAYEGKMLATATRQMDSEHMKAALEQRMQQLETEMLAGMQGLIAGGSSTSSPASSASAPTPSVSANSSG